MEEAGSAETSVADKLLPIANAVPVRDLVIGINPATGNHLYGD
jgi:hypothetical protein